MPVIPVAISGAHRALPAGALFPRFFTEIQVDYLNAIFPQNYTFDTLTEKVKEVISKKI